MSDLNKPTRKAISKTFLILSALNGWSLLVVGGISLLISVIASAWAGVLVSGAVSAHGVIELRLRDRLRKTQARADARKLAFNQIGLAVSLSVYFLYQFATINGDQIREMAMASPAYEILLMYPEAIRIELMDALPTFLGGFYLIAMGLCWVACGSCALFYGWQGNRVHQRAAVQTTNVSQ